MRCDTGRRTQREQRMRMHRTQCYTLCTSFWHVALMREYVVAVCFHHLAAQTHNPLFHQNTTILMLIVLQLRCATSYNTYSTHNNQDMPLLAALCYPISAIISDNDTATSYLGG